MSAEVTAECSDRGRERREKAASAPVRFRAMEPVVDETTEDAGVVGAELVEEELLIEEISIDGMCGVY
jgi:mycofactocin precursor